MKLALSDNTMMVFLFSVMILLTMTTIHMATGQLLLSNGLAVSVRRNGSYPKNVRSMKFSLMTLFVPLNTLSIKFDGDIIVLPTTKDDVGINKILCVNESDHEMTIDVTSITTNSIEMSFSRPVRVGQDIDIECSDLYYDWNNYLNIYITPRVSSPEYPKIEPQGSDIGPINDDYIPRGISIAKSIELFVDKKPQVHPSPAPTLSCPHALQLKDREQLGDDFTHNIRDFSIKFTKSSLLDRAMTLSFGYPGVLKKITKPDSTSYKSSEDPIAGCKINNSDDILPASFYPQHNTIVLDFETHPIPEDTDFTLSCDEFVYLDFTNYLDRRLSVGLDIPNDPLVRTRLWIEGVDDDKIVGFYTEVKIALSPYDNNNLPNQRLFTFTLTKPVGKITEDELMISFETESFFPVSSHQLNAHSTNFILQIDPTTQPYCLLNQQRAKVWLSPADSAMSIDISSIGPLGDTLEIDCDGLYLNFHGYSFGRPVPFAIIQGLRENSYVSSQTEPVNDQGWFSSVEINLLAYPNKMNAEKNKRSFILKAFDATGTIGHEIQIRLDQRIVWVFDPGSAPSCYVNNDVKVLTETAENTIIYFTLPESFTLKKGDDITITCDDTLYFDFSYTTEPGQEAQLVLSHTGSVVMVKTAVPPVDDDKLPSLAFETFTAELKVTNQAGLNIDNTHTNENTDGDDKIAYNKRLVTFHAKNAQMDFIVGDKIILAPSKPLFVPKDMSQNELKCYHINDKTIELPSVLDPKKGGVTMSVIDDKSKITKGSDFSFECTLSLNFESHLDQVIELALLSDQYPTTRTVTSIDPINDHSKPPSELFHTFTVILNEKESVGTTVKNLRDFTIVGENLQRVSLDNSLYVRFDQDILVSSCIQENPIKCSWGPDLEKQSGLVSDFTSHGFKIDMKANPIDIGTERIEMKCDQLHLDFKLHKKQIIPLYVYNNPIDFIVSMTNLLPIDDGDDDGTITWPMTVEIPTLSKQQPYLSLKIDNLPTFVDTKSNEMMLNITFIGDSFELNQNTNLNGTKSLHYITLRSYPAPSNRLQDDYYDDNDDGESDTMVTSGFPLDLNVVSSNGSINMLNVTFPPNHINLSLEVQLATLIIFNNVQAKVELTMIEGDRMTYRPKTNPNEFHYNPQLFDVDGNKNMIQTTFNEYIGEKKKNTYGPNFDLTFPATNLLLNNRYLTLQTNTTLPFIDTRPSFFFLNSKNYYNDTIVDNDTMLMTNHTCTIPQFKNKKNKKQKNEYEIQVLSDANRQKLIFNLTGVTKLNELNQVFSLQCPTIGLIVHNNDEKHYNNPIAMVLSSNEKDHIIHVNSFVATPPKHGKSHAMIVAILVLLVILSMIFGAFIVSKCRRSSSDLYKDDDRNTSPLLGGPSITVQ